MKLLSWNIYAGGYKDYEVYNRKPEKLDLIVKAIKEADADFVSLVDVNGWNRVFSNEELSRIFEYKHVFQVTIISGCEIGITVMTNLELISFEKLLVSDRYCVKSRVKAGGKVIDVISMYLDNRDGKARLEQIRNILTKADSDIPTILCGDLNTIRKGELNWLMRLGINILGLNPIWSYDAGVVNGMVKDRIIELLESSGFIDGDISRQKTIPSRTTIKGMFGPFLRLDYMFGNKHINVKKFEVIRNKLIDHISDHYPIIVEIEVE